MMHLAHRIAAQEDVSQGDVQPPTEKENQMPEEDVVLFTFVASLYATSSPLTPLFGWATLYFGNDGKGNCRIWKEPFSATGQKLGVALAALAISTSQVLEDLRMKIHVSLVTPTQQSSARMANGKGYLENPGIPTLQIQNFSPHLGCFDSPCWLRALRADPTSGVPCVGLRSTCCMTMNVSHTSRDLPVGQPRA